MTPPPASIEGTWQMIRAELNGEPAPELVTRKTVLELKAGNYAVRYAGQMMDSGTYELGTEAGHMVLRGTSGTNAGRVIPCRYRVAGNRLRVCLKLACSDHIEASNISTTPPYITLYRRVSTPL